MERGYVVMPIAPTSAMPLKLDAPGLHEGMYLPLPQLVPVPDSSLPNVVFVHMRQFYRMQQRRLEKADGDFHFSISIRKERRTRTLVRPCLTAAREHRSSPAPPALPQTLVKSRFM